MHVAIIGYGKMGHMIESEAQSRGHRVVVTIDPAAKDASVIVAAGNVQALIDAVKTSGAEAIIEFSHPSAVVANITALLPLGLPLVVGTTGWKDKENEIASLAASTGGVLLRSANFSLGVNLFYKLVGEAARFFADFDEYDAAVWEAHHNQKADCPSGTALEIARRICTNDKKKKKIVTGTLDGKPKPDELTVSSTRVGNMPGTHTVFFDSAADTIELIHTARSREGFATGAVHALERLCMLLKEGKLERGKLYGMEDVL